MTEEAKTPDETSGSESLAAPGSAAPRYFTVGELWGPCPCLVDGCPSYLAWTIKLTAEENNKLPEQSGPEAVKYIFKHKLGIPMCESCLGKEKR
jgi:hypothetical protein